MKLAFILFLGLNFLVFLFGPIRTLVLHSQKNWKNWKSESKINQIKVLTSLSKSLNFPATSSLPTYYSIQPVLLCWQFYTIYSQRDEHRLFCFMAPIVTGFTSNAFIYILENRNARRLLWLTLTKDTLRVSNRVCKQGQWISNN